ncbi:hypothetical protein R9C00_27200 [Flammeovirgaceae bacterium SG7u.111]|nr:hypothetical protein [Flammeovirgaceae bacterium SG7u.132]WPO35389.1 hypothetical protein R9C00_27200 [Flammeovirgaceae bacterium SG7u.111]
MKKTFLPLLAFSFLALSFILSKNVTTVFVNTPGVEVSSSSESGGRLRTGNVELENNVWGLKGDGYSYKIFTKEDKTFGWEWRTPGGQDGSVKMYLQAIIGHKPFFHYTIGKGFPFIPKELKSMKVHFKYEGSYQGRRNLAFEFWTVDEYHGDNEYINTRKDGSKNIIGEYMFWMQASYGMPIKHENVEIDGRKWNVAAGDPGHTYVAFMPANGDIKEATIDFKPFMDWLIANNYLKDTDKVISLELGNEVIEGTGKTLIKDYSVTIEK